MNRSNMRQQVQNRGGSTKLNKTRGGQTRLYKAGGATDKAKQKEPVSGGPDTVPYTEDRKAFLKRLQKQNKETRAKSAKKNEGYAKGGSVGKPRGCGIAKRGHGKARMS